MPSQWRSYSPITYQFDCCKICSQDCIFSSYQELDEAMNDLRSVMNTLKATPGVWLAFFQEWMTLPYRLRKDLSYHGGIRMQPGEVRMAVHNGELDVRNRAAAEVQYHDPGNFIYALAMRLMWPEFGEQHGYNQETIGDIFEGILALHVF